MSLKKLIAPFTIDDFLATQWEVDHMHFSRNDERFFSNIHDDLQLDQNIWVNDGAWHDISLARSRTSPSECEFLRDRATIHNLRAAINNGYTLVVNNYQKKSMRVAELCRGVEQDLLARCNVNLYLTGAGCQGLDAHYDDQDVFVLQIEGEKIWNIYEGGRNLPLDNEAYQTPDVKSSTFKKCHLFPGDVLYIPRGVVHEAYTQEKLSLHLTLAVSTVRWVTFFKQLLQHVAEENVAFRRALPREVLRYGHAIPAYDPQHFASLLVSAMSDSQMIEDVLAGLRRSFLAELPRLPSDPLIADSPEAGITVDSNLYKNKEQIWSIDEGSESIVLSFVGNTVSLSADLSDAVHFICKQESFRVKDIEGRLIDDQQKLGLAKYLVALGFLDLKSSAAECENKKTLL